jgi:release factor glutamine methyltransferase
MNLQEASKHITTQLSIIYSQREAQNICNLLLEEITTLSQTERIVNKALQLNEIEIKKVENSLTQLLLHKPIQQILGYTWFAGNKFLVDEYVLIPRPETEELAEYIVAENKGKQIFILDIGTGSGCIACSLKYKLANATVTAIDISNDALAIAKQNAANIGVDITLMQLNFLNKNTWKSLQQFDIIVSNPPYIKENEKQKMNDNVLLHEPHLALFVPDNDALIFYEKIAAFAQTHLKKDGTIWVEINEALGRNTAEVFINKGLQAEIKKDMQGKDRIIKAHF